MASAEFNTNFKIQVTERCTQKCKSDEVLEAIVQELGESAARNLVVNACAIGASDILDGETIDSTVTLECDGPKSRFLRSSLCQLSGQVVTRLHVEGQPITDQPGNEQHVDVIYTD